MNARLLLVLACALLLSSCGGGSGSPAPSPASCVQPCSYPLYLAVAQRGSGVVALYAPPFSGSPALTLPAPGAESLTAANAIDTPPTYYVGEYPSTIGASQYPYASIQPAITAGIDDPAGIAAGFVQTAAGSAVALFVANRGANDVAVIPLSTGSVLFTLNGLHAPAGVTFDGGQNLWVSQSGSVVEYLAPVTASSQPAVTISAGLKSPSGIAFDASGNMYVSDAGTNSVQMYAPGATTPTVTIGSEVNAPGAPYVEKGYLYVPNTGNDTLSAFALPLAAPVAPAWSNAAGMSRPSGVMPGF